MRQELSSQQHTFEALFGCHYLDASIFLLREYAGSQGLHFA